MAVETIRPGYAYKSDTLTAAYAGNHILLKGFIRQLKIIVTGGNAKFILNRQSDAGVLIIDGEIIADEDFRLDDMNQGIWSVGILGTGTYRLWAYS